MEIADSRPSLPEDRVGDEESLYRSVRERLFKRHSETEVTVSEHAYNDAGRKPSVDRAQINGSDPQPTRIRDGDAVVSLVTERVRGIDNVYEYSSTGRQLEPYEFDVIPRPIKADPNPEVDDNPAHAQVEADRDMSGSAFVRLKLALAAMSTAVVDPHEPLVYLTSTKKVYHKRTCRHLKQGRTAVAFTKLPTGAKPCCGCRPEDWGPGAAATPADGT